MHASVITRRLSTSSYLTNAVKSPQVRDGRRYDLIRGPNKIRKLITHSFAKPLPKVPYEYFGACVRPEVESSYIVPFKMEISEAQLQDLWSRIDKDQDRLTAPYKDVGHLYGFNTDYLKKVASYWRHDYNWAEQEAAINSIPQFKTNLMGLDIHFWRLIPQVNDNVEVVPLLLLHGYPNSSVEFFKLAPLLTQPRRSAKTGKRIAFEVIAPSYPGFGWSQGSSRPGMSVRFVARMMLELMARLGHNKFYCHGNDMGTFTTTFLATLWPDSVKGLHVTTPCSHTPAAFLKTGVASVPRLAKLVADRPDIGRATNMSEKLRLMARESAYMYLCATKPETLGAALNSSPLGLAAWMLEKHAVWTDHTLIDRPDGGLGKFAGGLDLLLNNVMINWFSRSAASSAKFFAENMASPDEINENLNPSEAWPVFVPTGVACFPKVMWPLPGLQPRSFLTGRYGNIVHFSRLEEGGTYPSMECPQLLAEDIFNFVNTVEKEEAEYQKTQSKSFFRR